VAGLGCGDPSDYIIQFVSKLRKNEEARQGRKMEKKKVKME
jgi:hypothetical protein